MDIKPIRTKADHAKALKLVSKLVELDPVRGTADGDMLDVMSTLVAAYEAEHFQMAPADPIEAIKFRMEQQGLMPRDLTPMIGRLNRVYEVLARRRPLTMPMAWRLHTQLGIPAESLIQPSKPI
jgi:HTH-type transcriptional regulator / antitoxin HigA